MRLSHYTFSMFWEVVIKKLRVWVLILGLEWTYWTTGKQFLDACGIHSFLYSAAPVIQATTPISLGLLLWPGDSPPSFSYLVTSSSYLNLLIGNHIPEPLSSPWPTTCTTRLPPPCSLVPGFLLCCGDLWQALSPQRSSPAPLLGSPSSRYSLSCFLLYFLTCSLMKCYLCREPVPTTLSKTGFLVLLCILQWHLAHCLRCYIC